MTLDTPSPSTGEHGVIGLIPAAGQATRIAPLPCSKELYPVGFRVVDRTRELRPKVACHYTLEKMRRANITTAYIVLRSGKWDIPAYLGDGALVDMSLAYLVLDSSAGVPFTLDQATPFVGDRLVAFAFPDILFTPDDAFVQALSHQATTGADVVLGAFPADDPARIDMLDVDENGRVHAIDIRPRHAASQTCWIFGVWTRVFQDFLHECVRRERTGGSQDELTVGHVLKEAIAAGLRVEATHFPDGTYLDIGTPDHLARAADFVSPAWAKEDR
jgi:glucose-1-phosphate thymidylyltransferase